MRIGREWSIVLGLALGVCISNAFSRFAYGLILPAVQYDLSWTYTQAGWINTANAIGYIIGALCTFALIGRVGTSKLFIAGILVTSLSLLASGFSSNFWMLTSWRILSGVAGAPTFIAGGAMVAALFDDDPKRNALAIAVFFGGGGFGMILSGAVLPSLLDLFGPPFWSTSWILLGLASFSMAPFSIWAALEASQTDYLVIKPGPLPIRKLRLALASYGLFAVGTIVFPTFVVAWMESLGLSVAMVSFCWILVGLGIIASPFVWKPVLAQYASGFPLAAACVVTGTATIGPIFMPNVLGLLLSSLFFGLALFIGPTAVTSFGRKNLPQQLWTKSVALFTITFAVGQSIGPIAAGAIGDYTGNLSAGLAAAGVALMLAGTFAALQRPL